MSEVIETKPVVTETPEEQVIRLQAEMTVLQASYTDLKTQAQARIAVLEGKATGGAVGGDQHLLAVTSQMAADAQELSQLKAAYFGGDAGCGIRSMELKRNSPKEYARLRSRFMTLSGQDKAPPPTGTISKAFH